MSERRGGNRRIPFLVLAAVTALASAGCSGSSGDAATGGQSHQTGSAQQRPVDHMRVGLTEWNIETSARQAEPGSLRLLVTNAGSTTHDLYVRGEDGTWHTRDLAPGGRQRLVVHAVAGERLHLWCSLPGHAAQGMRTTLSVARPAS